MHQKIRVIVSVAIFLVVIPGATVFRTAPLLSERCLNFATMYRQETGVHAVEYLPLWSGTLLSVMAVTGRTLLVMAQIWKSQG